MKNLFLLAGLLFTVSAQANPAEWLDCTTPGDALSSVSIALNEAGRPEAVGVLMSINDMDDSSTRYTSVVPADEFDRMEKESKYLFVMRTGETNEFGGAEFPAGMIQIDMSNPENITSLMAVQNAVYHMTCVKVVY